MFHIAEYKLHVRLNSKNHRSSLNAKYRVSSKNTNSKSNGCKEGYGCKGYESQVESEHYHLFCFLILTLYYSVNSFNDFLIFNGYGMFSI